MNFYRRSKFFCLSELRTDYFRERKRTFKTFSLLINEAIFRMKNKNQIQLNTESRKIRFNYILNTEHSPQYRIEETVKSSI